MKPVKVSSADAYLHLGDVSKLTKMSDASFEMMRTALSSEDFDFYATQRAAYKEAKATGKGVQKMPAVLNMVEVNKQMDGILSMLKIKTQPEQMSKFDKAKVSAIRKVFNKHLLESQMAEGKSYTKEEVANKLSEFVAEQVLKRSDSVGSNTSGFGAGKTAVKRDIFTVQASDISPVDIDRARNELARHGEHNSTDEQVTQAILERGEFQAQGARASDDASGKAGEYYPDSDRGESDIGESASPVAISNSEKEVTDNRGGSRVGLGHVMADTSRGRYIFDESTGTYRDVLSNEEISEERMYNLYLADIQTLMSDFKYVIREMEHGGIRLGGRDDRKERTIIHSLVNNLLSREYAGQFFGTTYERCLDQAEYLNRYLDRYTRSKLNIDWVFVVSHVPGHYYTEAIPNIDGRWKERGNSGNSVDNYLSGTGKPLPEGYRILKLDAWREDISFKNEFSKDIVVWGDSKHNYNAFK